MSVTLAACLTRLRELRVPEPFSAELFRRQLEVSRGRPLLVHPIPSRPVAASPCGLVVTTATADHVFVDTATSGLHREQILVHELMHIACGHVRSGTPGDARKLAQALLPDADPDLIQLVLGRTSYRDADEREAEMLASVALCGVVSTHGFLKPSKAGKHAVRDGRILRQLDESLGMKG